MRSGEKPLIIHSLHTIVVFYSVFIAVVFGFCFGFEDVDNYSILYSGESYTLLSRFYVVAIVIFLFLLAFFSSLLTLPYCVLYWLRYISDKTIGNKKGRYLTVFSCLFILLHPSWTLWATRSDEFIQYWQWLLLTIIFVSIILFEYVVPYLFIGLSYPSIKQLPCYKTYRIFLVAQLAMYFLLIVYWLTPLPTYLSDYIDSRYLHHFAG